ncbi:unnamed protein product [Cutaneotrichosporon oleaginosum]
MPPSQALLLTITLSSHNRGMAIAEDTMVDTRRVLAAIGAFSVPVLLALALFQPFQPFQLELELLQ